DVPGVPLADQDAARVLLDGDQTVVALSSGATGRLLVRRQDSWHLYTAPDGRLLAAALVGSRLFLVTEADDGDRLWVRDLGDLLRG
ncbi:MAG TPA: hypothetical protein VFU98_01995, partial [Microlunatus sp.]|nr:hypothetical protein [Microlunatus sp.]